MKKTSRRLATQTSNANVTLSKLAMTASEPLKKDLIKVKTFYKSIPVSNVATGYFDNTLKLSIRDSFTYLLCYRC